MGTMKNVGEYCNHGFKASHRSVAICHKWAKGTCLMLGFVMQDGAIKSRSYLAGHEPADDTDTVVEEVFGMGS